jgi:hypothetical protein
MKKQFFWTVVLIFAIGLFFTVGLDALASPQEGKKTPLAGNPIFPDEEYSAWMKVQVDPSIKDADKVVCTIDTFFNIKYKSWMKLELLDFGFLFDRLNAQGAEDYAYERGFYNMWMVAWRNPRYPRQSLDSYKYEPSYRQLSVDEDRATVRVRPNATIVMSDTKRTSSTPWQEHTFTLIHKNDLWLIRSVVSHDEMRDIYPPGQGTDFQKIADSLYEDEEKALIKQEAEFNESMKDPKAQQIFLSSRASLKGFVTRGLKVRFDYHPSLAVSYALQYSSEEEGHDSYNYPTFLYYPSDCQNFVSQCVYFGFYPPGGDAIEEHLLPMIDDGVAPHPWWGDSEGASSNLMWTGVTQFINLTSDNRLHLYLGPYSNSEWLIWARPGDIAWSSTPKHAMMISEWWDRDGDWYADWNELYICAHTNNHRNYQLSKLYTSSSYVGYRYVWFWDPSE